MIIMRVSGVLLMNFVLTMHGVPLARRISRRYCVAILPNDGHRISNKHALW